MRRCVPVIIGCLVRVQAVVCVRAEVSDDIQPSAEPLLLHRPFSLPSCDCNVHSHLHLVKHAYCEAGMRLAGRPYNVIASTCMGLQSKSGPPASGTRTASTTTTPSGSSSFSVARASASITATGTATTGFPVASLQLQVGNHKLGSRGLLSLWLFPDSRCTHLHLKAARCCLRATAVAA